MRTKIMLIKGFAGIAKKITMAEFERINADNVVLIAALRRPQFTPPNLENPARMLEAVEEVLAYWKRIEMQHLLCAEYANMLIDREEIVKVVEGNSLKVDWFYDSVKAIHKNMDQKIVEAEVKGFYLLFEGQELKLEEAIERLKPPIDLLG